MHKTKLKDNLNLARPLKRPKLHSSRLLYTLADLSLADTASSRVAFAEKLALWVDFTHAIKLSALLNIPADQARTPPASTHMTGQRLAQVRISLEQMIRNGCTPKVFKAQVELHSPALEVTSAPPTDHEPYRRYYLSLQRDMETTVRALRLQVRETLSKASPTLKKLALLDATFDSVLIERESKLLTKLPALLEQQFAADRAHHTTEPPDDWLKPGHWLHRFSQAFETMLLAELDLRLQAITGLVEALQHETHEHP